VTERLENQFKTKLQVFHIANERKASKQYHVKLARMGVISGVADYCVIYEKGRVAFIEFKRNAKCKLSDSQKNFKADCEDLEIPYLLTYSVSEAIDFLSNL
jgi:hypothetical protein